MAQGDRGAQAGAHASGGAPAPRRPADCLSCRVTGSVVCGALSAYLLAQHYARPSASPIHQRVTLAMAGGFAALGIARALV
jgi:hypothetical protein